MIGPDLPPHLAARRRQRQQQQQQQPQDQRSSAERTNADASRAPGPAPAPAPASDASESAAASIGPALPPHLLAARNRKRARAETEGSDDSKSGPAPAPALAPARARVSPAVGPARPPPPHGPSSSSRPSAASEDDDDDDDDVVGPRPPSPTLLALQQDPAYLAALQQREAADRLAAAERDRAQAAADAAAAASAEPQRGEWMLVPPTALAPGLAANPMRSRTFAKREADYNVDKRWTESPAERAERLRREAEDARLGRTSGKDKGKGKAGREKVEMSARDRELAAAVAGYNAATRPKTLLAEYESGSASETKKRRVAADHDGERRPFDRERDVLGHRPVDAGKRQEMVENAKDLGSKFAHGSRAFL
ncbi:hypothetical protein GGF31_007004 [Allomyces arbusculus]|nr:hypothetical protein GGF31_007004 [Allomyces arbusculus]